MSKLLATNVSTPLSEIIQAVHSLLYIVAKCNLFSVVTWKYIIKYVKNVRGVLTSVRYCITVWFGSATKTDIRRLQRTVGTAERIIGAPLPSLQERYTSRVRKRAKKVTLDPSHPAHSLFELLSSGRRYRSVSTKTTRHKNTFSPQTISHLNNT